ncbi:MAG: hypothetical protein SPK63_02095 [Eubacteriales bacterium]|jgi:hypothetical protein|nr:hypothetical protein [Eubacteriales bacterium]
MKWYTYLICFILIIVGVFCGIELYKEIKAESYVNGSIDISNKFSQESFNYSSSSVAFYHDDYDTTDTYTFQKDLLVVDSFNGKEKTYQVILNDYILFNTEFNPGSIFSNVAIDFYDTEGNVICNADMKISIVFLSNKTQLTLATVGDKNSSFLQQYFTDNGIRLRVVEIL